MTSKEIKYNFEYDQKLRAAFIGAGGHSYRNIYPTFKYAPVDLLAICDPDGKRAAAYARQFGARSHYTDHQEMLERERSDAVFIVTSYYPDGRVQATDLALDALAAGAHVGLGHREADDRSVSEALARDSIDVGIELLVLPGSEQLLHRLAGVAGGIVGVAPMIDYSISGGHT